MFYRVGDYLLNLNEVGVLHIFQPSMQQQAQLFADGITIFSGTREEVEAKLDEISRLCGAIPEVEEVVEVAPEPEPEEVVESEDDATDEEE